MYSSMWDITPKSVTSEVLAHLDEEVIKLPKIYRIPFIQLYFEGQSHEEVAQNLHIKVATLKQRLVYARNQLRKQFAEHGLSVKPHALRTILFNQRRHPKISEDLIRATVKIVSNIAKANPILLWSAYSFSTS